MCLSPPLNQKSPVLRSSMCIRRRRASLEYNPIHRGALIQRRWGSFLMRFFSLWLMISLTGVTHPPLNGGQSALEADGLLSFCAQVYGDSKETSKKKSRRPSKALKEKKRRSTSSTKSASKARKKKLSKKRKKRKKRKKKRKKRKRKGLKAQPALKLRQLTHSYERSLKRAELKGARVAWLIVDGSSGEVISSHQPELKLHPASNTKIATTAAAYVILSPDFTYETQWYTEPPPWELPFAFFFR